VTNSSNSRSSRRRDRRDASREPPTIDLSAKVVDEGRAEAAAAPPPEAEVPPAAAAPPDEPVLAPGVADEVPADPPIGARVADSPGPSAPESARAEPEPHDGSAASADGPLPGEPSVAPAPPAREPARRGAGFGALLTAALLGGVIGSGLLYGIQRYEESLPGQEPAADLDQRLAGFARQDAVQGLDGRLGALEAAQGALSGEVAAARARADEAFNRPAPEPAPAAPPENSAALNDLTNRLAALEGQARDAAQAATAAGQALERRLGEQEQRLAALDGRLGPLDQRVAALDQRLGGLDGRLGGLDGRLGDLDGRLGALGGRLDTVDQRLGTLDQRLGATARQVAEGGSETTRAGTRVVLADRLADALREGAPYAEPLAALRRLSPESAAFTPLEPYAAGGAPNAAALAQSFKPLGERILREARPPAEDWTDRLARMAERVVTVRAVDDPSGTGVPALVGRIEAALARGAFADAVAAWDALPEPSRALSAAWGEELKRRAAAEAAARAVSADAIAALNPATR
jgi:hypothetical protein